jgi:hypothetical protein
LLRESLELIYRQYDREDALPHPQLARPKPTLIGRGSLTLWVDEEAIRCWRYSGPTGRRNTLADTASRYVLSLRAVYHLALRVAEKLARSVFELIEVPRRDVDLTVALGAMPRSTPLRGTKLRLGVDEATSEIGRAGRARRYGGDPVAPGRQDLATR